MQFPTQVHYVDWNTGLDSGQDMFLMSRCRHNIIANSTFSWWGAWLNTNVEKIVIAPERFMNDAETPDFIPESWIKNSQNQISNTHKL
ncbi:hypothetical protein AGMMS49525_01500 [Bacteroidia bacterium]|nr:hypothetical protein AGMMS49525_01500 [Bacteroidia bacterium]